MARGLQFLRRNMDASEKPLGALTPRQAELLSRVLGARVRVEIAAGKAVAAFPRAARPRARTAGG